MNEKQIHFKGFSAATSIAANALQAAIESGHNAGVERRPANTHTIQEREQDAMRVEQVLFGEGQNGDPAVSFEPINAQTTEVSQIIDRHITHKQ